MSKDKDFDIVIIGGGIVGLSSAMQLAERFPSKRLLLIEKEDKIAAHQTGHNSGVIHSGIYYKPGSLKAENCKKGYRALIKFCKDHNISFDICGKVIVASNKEELPALQQLYERGIKNGLTDLALLSEAELHNYEPAATGVAAIHVPQTGIVDFQQVAEAYAKQFQSAGGTLSLNTRVIKITQSKNFILNTNKEEISAKFIINCAGLHADRIAKICGIDPGLRIIPFRGEYFELKANKCELINNLIYPVPDPRFPFLGVHFTRMIDGTREIGPNAVLAFKREGYRRSSLSLRDLLETFSYLPFWQMVFKYGRMGFSEQYRSLFKAAFVKSAQKLIPDITAEDIVPASAGVRAQAVERGGRLVDDFRIIEKENMLHVLNAPSPAATASLAIGATICNRAAKQL